MDLELNTKVAECVMGWRRSGKGDHIRPLHIASLDFPGEIINDFGSKGEHDFLHPPDDALMRVAFCGCDSTTELPDYAGNIDDAWLAVQKMQKLGFQLILNSIGDPLRWRVRFYRYEEDGAFFDLTRWTFFPDSKRTVWGEAGLPDALCRAALLSLEHQQKAPATEG